MLVLGVILGIATFVEKYLGTEIAKVFIYYSPIVFLIQFLLVVNFLAVCSRYQLIRKEKIAFVIIHFAFIIILIGAFITHLFGVEGTIHLRENESKNSMLVKTNMGQYLHQLPFTISLEKFTLTRYPGSTSPSSFESAVKINDKGEVKQAVISMNNVLDINGYRLFQASYDTDEKGTILSVNKDVAGRTISYTGYFLLIVGFILSFVAPQSHFRNLIKQLNTLQASKSTLIVLLFFFSLPAFSTNNSPSSRVCSALQEHKIPEYHAKLFGAIPMQSTDGRIKPINTFSSEVIRKIHHSDKIGELNPDQALLSLITFSEMWKQAPVIYQPNEEIGREYGISIGYCSYAELFNPQKAYKLEQQVKKSYALSPSQRSKFDKEIIKLDERINIFHQLINHRLLRIFPLKDDPAHRWYASGDDLSVFVTKDSLHISELTTSYLNEVRHAVTSGNWTDAQKMLVSILHFQESNNTTLNVEKGKIEAELLFNELGIFQSLKRVYLVLGGILVLLTFTMHLKKNRWIHRVINLSISLVIISMLFHIYSLALRGYIGGYAPWSNSYETMVYISLVSIITGLIFVRKSKITFALSTLFAGIILFVAGLNWMDPQISTLVPVLKSPWLMIHVAVIVAAYSFFGVSCLLGISNVIMLSIKGKFKNLYLRIQELSIINEMSLLIGLALMTIGTFLGAVWANESWGRYWGWDSKETWALITILVYAIVTHLRFVKKLNNPWVLNIMSIIAFLSVLMTYFGVNYYLSGLHSYS